MVDSTAFSNLPGGQFTPESGGQFDPKWGGQFRPEQVVSLNRIGLVSFTEFSKATETQKFRIFQSFSTEKDWRYEFKRAGLEHY